MLTEPRDVCCWGKTGRIADAPLFPLLTPSGHFREASRLPVTPVNALVIAFTFAEMFQVSFGFPNRTVTIFANFSGISARCRLGIYDQAFFVIGPDDPPISHDLGSESKWR